MCRDTNTDNLYGSSFDDDINCFPNRHGITAIDRAQRHDVQPTGLESTATTIRLLTPCACCFYFETRRSSRVRAISMHTFLGFNLQPLHRTTPNAGKPLANNVRPPCWSPGATDLSQSTPCQQLLPCSCIRSCWCQLCFKVFTAC